MGRDIDRSKGDLKGASGPGGGLRGQPEAPGGGSGNVAGALLTPFRNSTKPGIILVHNNDARPTATAHRNCLVRSERAPSDENYLRLCTHRRGSRLRQRRTGPAADEPVWKFVDAARQA